MSQFLDGLYFTPLAEGRSFRINKPFRYESDLLLAKRERNVVTAPQGRITDWASTPRMLWARFPPWERYSAAAVVHDEIYWTQDLDRELGDMILREGMVLLGVDAETVDVIYNAVRIFGGEAWKRNAALKAAGYTKLAPMTDAPPYASAV